MYGEPAIVQFLYDWSRIDVAISRVLAAYWKRDAQYIVRSVCKAHDAQVLFW